MTPLTGQCGRTPPSAAHLMAWAACTCLAVVAGFQNTPEQQRMMLTKHSWAAILEAFTFGAQVTN